MKRAIVLVAAVVGSASFAFGADRPNAGVLSGGSVLSGPVIPPGSGANRFGALETRPIWERSAAGSGLLQRETERALDRSNGRIDDPALFDIEQIARQNALRSLQNDGRADFELFQRERDRQTLIDQQQRTQQQQTQRKKIYEVESQKLADERERWLRFIAKPRHGEAAVVDRQMREATTRTSEGKN